MELINTTHCTTGKISNHAKGPLSNFNTQIKSETNKVVKMLETLPSS